jgi:hypothetical protein
MRIPDQMVIRAANILIGQSGYGAVAIEIRKMDFPGTVRLAPEDLNDSA